MSVQDFEILLNLIGPEIKKNNTNFREAIPIKERLAVTLRFLATGDSFTSLQYLFKILKQSISQIIPEVCKALIKALMNYIKLPTTPEKWLAISNDFENLWQFPHCVGSMDGKHITLQAPINTGSEYYNYKGFFSIVLFAIVDAKYNFLFVDIGCQGRISDGGVFQNSQLYNKIVAKTLNLPLPKQLYENQKYIPYFFIADEAFPLTENIMKLYSGLFKRGIKKRIFNYRLSRARRIVENAFGIMSSVFRVFRKPLLLEPEKAKLIVMTAVLLLLHNYLRKSQTSQNIYTPPGSFDTEEDGQIIDGSWRKEHLSQNFHAIQNVPHRATIVAKSIREEHSNYFMTIGKVPRQDEYA